MDSPVRWLKLKGYFVAKQLTLKHLKSGKTYGIVLAAIVFLSLLTWLMYPEATQAERSLVFLRNTLPVEASAAIEIPEELPEAVANVDPDQELIEMLKMDDSQIAYAKQEDKQSWHVVRMRTTGYCACRKCCGKFSDGKTASNHKIRMGDTFVAADKYYRFDTEMIVPGYNADRTVSVQDRGRVIKGNRLDLYFDSHRQAQKWGVQYLDVLVREK